MVESSTTSQQEPKSAFVDAEGLRLHYLEWDPNQQEESNPARENEVQAGDEIPLVMLHGLGATANTWQLVAPHLCHHHLVVAFDQRGHGLSEKPDSGYDLLTIAEDAVHGMAALGLGKVALVGHGWGARVALVLAARHPALVSHLVLVDCPHVEPRHWPGMTRERFLQQKTIPSEYASAEAFLNALQEEMAPFWSPTIASIARTFVHELPDGRVEEQLSPEHQRLIRESLWEDRALSYYGKLRCPVLLVPAAEQPRPGVHPPEKLEHADEFSAAKGFMAAQVARAIARCTVLWMADTAHDIHLQRPERLAAAIARFVREE